MNKKLYSLVLFAVVIIGVSSCTPQKTKQIATTPNPSASADVFKVAYINVDSFMTQYQYCKDFSLLLMKDTEDAKARLSRIGLSLQKDVQNFQKKVQNNEFLLRSTAEKEQKKLQKREKDLNELQQKLANALTQKQQEFNNNMRDSIQNFLKEYNKSHNYSMILSKAGDNILLSDPQLDITKEVVNALNNRYKPSM